MSLVIVHVDVRVLPDAVERFREATLANARASVQEPGVVRFDVVQDTADPTRFVLAEAFRNPEARAAHWATPHYLTWRETVAPLMAEPRTSRVFTHVHPAEDGW